MNTLSNSLKVIFAALCLIPFMAGCNTIAGAGEDVEATGEGIQKAAEKTEEELEETF